MKNWDAQKLKKLREITEGKIQLIHQRLGFSLNTIYSWRMGVRSPHCATWTLLQEFCKKVEEKKQ
jgi:DNA-binding transcriptional regulator YiaG